MPIIPLFTKTGKLAPSVTIIGAEVSIADEVLVLNSIVLPHIAITSDIKNEITL